MYDYCTNKTILRAFNWIISYVSMPFRVFDFRDEFRPKMEMEKRGIACEIQSTIQQ